MTTEAPSKPASTLARVAPYAWAVVFMLWPVAALNYLDRMMVATMRQSIRADIPSISNDAQFGALMATFMWVYAILSPLGGYVADRFNRRRTVIASLFIWSAATWAAGHSHTFGQMATAMALMGMSEACYMPAALALIADFHPGPTRARGVSIHVSGVYAGQALGGIGGYIADTSSWRNAFYWFGLAGLLYSVVLLMVLRDAPRPPAGADTREPKLSFGNTLRGLFGAAGFLFLIAYFTLPGIPGWEVKNWLPTHLATTFGLTQGPAGLKATGFVTLAALAGTLIGGAGADHFFRRTIRGRIYTSALGTALCIPALLGLGFAPSLGVAVVSMMAFGLGFGIFDTNSMPILCQLVSSKYRATGYGVLNLVGISSGAVVTWGLGAMRDHNISLRVAFSLSAFVPALAVLLILLVRPKDPAYQPTHSEGSGWAGSLLVLSAFMTFLVAGGDPAKPDLPTLVPALALLIAGIYTFASSRLWRVAAASAVAVAYILVTVLLNGRGLSRFDVAEFLVLALALAASGLKARTLAPAAGQ